MNNRSIVVCAFLPLLLSLGRLAAGDEPEEYRVVPGESEIHVLVFRAGALGRLGHNHVVTARDLSGHVSVGDTAQRSAFELSLDVALLAVDDPGARSDAGSAFAGEVSEDDRSGTRRNMLGDELLDAARHPQVRVRSSAISGDFDDMTATAEIEIKGERRVVELPVNAVFYGDRLVATGRTTLTHAALGLSPFSAGLGTLRVADKLTFRYHIVATRTESPAAVSARQRAPAVVHHDGIAFPDRAAK